MENNITFCPICWHQKKKLKTFRAIKHLNIHLTLKHEVKYKYVIAGQTTHRKIGVKPVRLAGQSV